MPLQFEEFLVVQPRHIFVVVGLVLVFPSTRAWGQVTERDAPNGLSAVERTYWTGRLRLNTQSPTSRVPFLLEESWFGPWLPVVPADGLELAPLVNKEVILRGRYDLLPDGRTRVLLVERAYASSSSGNPLVSWLFGTSPPPSPTFVVTSEGNSSPSKEPRVSSDNLTDEVSPTAAVQAANHIEPALPKRGAGSRTSESATDRDSREVQDFAETSRPRRDKNVKTAQADSLPPPDSFTDPYTLEAPQELRSRPSTPYWSDSPYSSPGDPHTSGWLGLCPSCGARGLAAMQGSCPSPERFWIQGEYLHWWTSGLELPPLVTTSAAGTPAASAGVFGLPTTTVLFGNSEVNDTDQVGWRVSGGMWLGPWRRWGVEVDYFQLDDPQENFQRSSNGNLILARPYFDIVSGAEAAELIAFPGVASGDVSGEAITQWMNAGGRVRWSLCCGTSDPQGSFLNGYRVDLTGGYRFARLSDQVDIRHNSTDLSTGTTTFAEDLFVTGNEFHGGEVGIVWERRRGRWILTGAGRIALGNNRQTVRIEGRSIIDDGTGPQTFTGGVLAQSSNIGFRSRDEFAILPELGLTLGLQLTNWARVTVGYNFLYMSNVVRAGDIIDRDLNPGLLPPPSGPLTGPARPRFTFHETDFWSQGLTAGVDVRF